MHPLTTALSSRDYEVSGVFTGTMSGPDGAEPPHGVLEVGYQIGCGIDMSTSQGVTLTGSQGVTPSVGLLGIDVAGPAARRNRARSCRRRPPAASRSV